MKLELSKEQFRELLLDVIIGVYVREAVLDLQGKDFSKVEELEKYLLSVAENFDAGDMVENFKGALIPSEKVCKEYEDIIEEYNNDEFWSRLEIDLGKRDFWESLTEEEKREIEKEKWLPERVHDFYDYYAKEFEENGIENLRIVKEIKKR
jgi:hypothetical protein